MRALIQRVAKAQVSVDSQVISSIGSGLCVLIGICRQDSQMDLEYIIRKILNTKLFDDNGQRWKKSVSERQMEILCISQFTLYHELKGNKPDFHHAMAPQQAQEFYNSFLDALRKQYLPEKIKDGKFGEYMQVKIQNDGPVTIMLDSNEKTNKKSKANAEPSEK